MKSTPLTSGASFYAHEYNALRSDAKAAAFLLAHQQLGALALPTNPSDGQTITLTPNGTNVVLTGRTGAISNPGEFKIQATPAKTMAVIAAGLLNPTVTTSTFIALGAANAQLIQYLGWGYPAGGTTITPYSLNSSTYAPLTSFSASTTVTGGSWTGQTMQLYVEDGPYYINGVRYLFTGGSTPTVTAPASNPRIDVLTIDSSGTLAWTTGAENASPTAPSYPSNKIVLCELYNLVGETALYDNANQQTSQGYILNDVRPTATYPINPGAIATNIIPDAADTRDLGSVSKEFNNIYGKNIVAATTLTVGGLNVAMARFGGTGTDGALTVTSGTTNIDLGGASVFIKNYSSISITGTGAISFSNPAAGGTLIIFKCAGNCTITSSANPVMDLTGLGSAGGTTNGTGQAFGQWTLGNITGGTTGTNSSGAHGGGGGASSTANGNGNGTNSNGGLAPTFLAGKPSDAYIRYPVVPGSGGGGGQQSGTADTLTGGRGGGAIVFEVAGALNITSAFQSNGGAGTSTGNAGNGGGGGGGGGFFFFIYNTLIANAATFTTNAGGGGTGGTGGGTGGGGAAGGSSVVQNQVWV